MSRTVKPWVGKTDDSTPSAGCKRRIVDRQNGLCAISGRPLAGKKIEYDHVVPLWLGGLNTEGNLQAVIDESHKAKTKIEATVRAKVNAAKDRHYGITAPAQKIRSAPFPKRERQRVVTKAPLAARNVYRPAHQPAPDSILKD